MPEKSYALQSDEKATQVMFGTPDMLLWGDLVTKEHIRIGRFLNTLAEDFITLRDAKILFLAPAQKAAPLNRASAYVKLEEILLFFDVNSAEPLPEESEVRRFEPVEAIVGPFRIEASLLKSPIATIQNLLLVSKEIYLPLHRATICHVAKPWLGEFMANLVLVRRDRLTLVTK
jgi:hypothetical protein